MVDLPDIFSRRGKSDTCDVFQYDVISNKLRMQVLHILERHIFPIVPEDIWMTALETSRQELLEEYGRNMLAEHNILEANVIDPYNIVRNDCQRFFLHEQKTAFWLDLLELILRYLERFVKPETVQTTESVPITSYDAMPTRSSGINQVDSFDKAISRLNARFKLDGFGFHYENGRIVRMDHMFTHTEMVLPAFHLLGDKRFKNALDEFEKAHEHYRARNHKECVCSASDAVESTLKIICKHKRWGEHDKTKQGVLMNTVFKDNQLLPDYCKSGFQTLFNIRGQDAAHGQGSTASTLTEHMARYALHLAAANIVLLVDAFQN